jgi:hypothetical protein
MQLLLVRIGGDCHLRRLEVRSSYYYYYVLSSQWLLFFILGHGGFSTSNGEKEPQGQKLLERQRVRHFAAPQVHDRHIVICQWQRHLDETPTVGGIYTVNGR